MKAIRTRTLLCIFLLPITLYAQVDNAAVPPVVLCYHQVRNWTSQDGRVARDYIVPVERFKQHMSMLRDKGFHVILPTDLLAYQLQRKKLPPNSVLISFDDGTVSQYTTALPVLEKYGFKAVFFIMTVTLDRPGYLSRSQILSLKKAGHVIGCHTWDHHKVTSYNLSDWEKQLLRPTKVLAALTGDKIQYFAYPYGLWDTAAITQLWAAGYTAAFQLYGKQDIRYPQYTIRRIIANGHWDGQQLEAAISGISGGKNSSLNH